MSASGSLSGISFSGLGSGIDTDSIVRQLMAIERIPIQRLQVSQRQLENKSSIYGDLKSQLTSLLGSFNTLNQATSFASIKVASSDESVATATASSASGTGTFNLSVTKLAQAHKFMSSAQSSATTALGYSGSLVVNGKSVKVEATDTLNAVAGRINGVAAGVTATVITGANGSAYLSVTASNTGAANKVQISTQGAAGLAGLGLTTGAATFREQPTAGTVVGAKFTSNTDSLGTLLGRTGAGTLSVLGQAVAIDFDNDDLSDLATKINALGTAVTASVESVTDGGTTKYRLSLTGVSSESDFADTDSVLEGLGVLQRSFGNELLAAQDAELTVDGIAVKSATNTLTDAVAGVTINLLKADVAGAKTTVSLTRDADKVKSTIKAMVSSYNAVVGYVKSMSAFDTETFSSGPLFGDSVAQNVLGTLESQIFKSFGSGKFTNLTQLGFGVNDKGELTLDESKLDAAVLSDAEGVRRMFMNVGSATGSGLTFITASNKTQSSPSGGYAIDITQLATKGNMLAATAQTVGNVGETLTFNGSLFSNQEVVLNVSVGATLNDLVNQINADSRLNGYVTASIDGGGKLQLDSKKFGTNGDFSVLSNLDAAVDNSGIGTGTGLSGSYTAGLNVAGTINGLAATGQGQFLTGNAGTNADGLQVQYTGNTLGTVGNVTYSRGMSSMMTLGIETYTDSVNGLLVSSDNSIKDQISDITDKIAQYETNLTIREQTLRLRFNAMERAVSQLQQQMAQLQSIRPAG